MPTLTTMVSLKIMPITRKSSVLFISFAHSTNKRTAANFYFYSLLDVYLLKMVLRIHLLPGRHFHVVCQQFWKTKQYFILCCSSNLNSSMIFSSSFGLYGCMGAIIVYRPHIWLLGGMDSTVSPFICINSHLYLKYI